MTPDQKKDAFILAGGTVLFSAFIIFFSSPETNMLGWMFLGFLIFFIFFLFIFLRLLKKSPASNDEKSVPYALTQDIFTFLLIAWLTGFDWIALLIALFIFWPYIIRLFRIPKSAGALLKKIRWVLGSVIIVLILWTKGLPLMQAIGNLWKTMGS